MKHGAHIDAKPALGLLRFTQNLQNQPEREDSNYTDAVRSALHFQFALEVLTPQGFAKNFKDLQQNAWLCHPLYSPDFPPPPHCEVPENSDSDFTSAPLSGSIQRLAGALPEIVEAPAQSAMQQLNLDTNPILQPREFQLSVDMIAVAGQKRGPGEPSDRTAPDALSTLSASEYHEPDNADQQEAFVPLGQLAESELPLLNGPRRAVFPESEDVSGND